MELYGDWQIGGLTGLNSGNITDTSWGFKTGGGVLYNLNENVVASASSVAGSATTSGCMASETFAMPPLAS